MSEDHRYNGWSNYETWYVKLWIDNEKSSYYYWRENARDLFAAAEADDTFTKQERATLDLSTALQDELIDGSSVPELEGMYGDLLRAALSEVDWYEIASSMLEDVMEDAE